MMHQLGRSSAAPCRRRILRRGRVEVEDTFNVNSKSAGEQACDMFLAGKFEEVCPCCRERMPGLVRVPSMTRYHWDGVGEDPNADFWACFLCAEQYIENMKERWAEYHAGCL